MRQIGWINMENQCCSDEFVTIWENDDGSYFCECGCHQGFNTTSCDTISEAVRLYEEINERHREL